jgi:hypothetical protein
MVAKNNISQMWGMGPSLAFTVITGLAILPKSISLDFYGALRLCFLWGLISFIGAFRACGFVGALLSGVAAFLGIVAIGFASNYIAAWVVCTIVGLLSAAVFDAAKSKTLLQKSGGSSPEK